MPQQCRLGDIVGNTGTLLNPGAPTVRVNDIIISTINDIVSPHGEPPHTKPTISTGSKNVFAENKAVTVVGLSVATCAHQPSSGSTNTFTNN